VLIKTNVLCGRHRDIGGSLALAPALDMCNDDLVNNYIYLLVTSLSRPTSLRWPSVRFVVNLK